MALKFSMILQAVDRVSAPVRKMQGAIGGWGASVRRMSREIESGGRSLEHYRRRAERLRGVALGRFFQASTDSARRLGRALGDLPRRLKLVERAGNAAKGGLQWMGGKALDIAKWGAAGAAAAGGFALFDLLRTASQFEQYQIQLEGIEGSAGKARQAMAWVQKFAATTPYELADVMEGFVALKAYGIDPMNGSLMALGDMASGMNKPLMQSVEAMADAMTGEFERLKEFGIRASKAGDMVTFTYRKNGKDIRRETKMTGEAIEKTLTGIMQDRFGGGMARQATTMAGIVSNLKDQWSKFLMSVANAGIFDKVKAKLQTVLDKVNAMAEDGRLEAWAERISNGLERAFDWGVRFVEETDWAKVGRDLQTVASAAVKIADAIVTMASWGQKLGWLGKLNDYAKFANPIYTAGRMAEQGYDLSQRGNARNPRSAKPAASRKPIAWPTSPARAPRYISRIAPRKTAANDVNVGGRMVVEVKSAPGTTARVASLQSNNRAVPIQANVGRTMAGAA